MERLCILKIGGSVLTDKSSTEFTVETERLRNIFNALVAIKSTDPELQLILIHGAGGHIHHLAHTFELKGGTGTDQTKIDGAHATHVAVKRLNTEVLKIAHDSALQLVAVPTDEAITQTDGRISTCDTEKIKAALKNNDIPVMYGDMVHDTTLGMSICSGDTITAHLTTLFPVTHILFATDVDGIFTDDPHTNASAQLIETLTFSDIKKNITLKESHNTDTTDGLRGKINACTLLFENASSLSEIHVFNGLDADNYSKVLRAKSFPHSRIIKE